MSMATDEPAPDELTFSTRVRLLPLKVNPPPTMVMVWPSVTLIVMASADDAKVMLPVNVMVSAEPSVLPVVMAAFSCAKVLTLAVCRLKS
ncbi:hypothetical protein D3C71_1753560 [compost metagenome]